MKKDKHHIDKLLASLEEGDGRVRAVKKAGISYQCFLNWCQDIELFELIKKAEDAGNDKIEDLCKRRIIEATQWQASAWWLERTKPHKYALNRQDNNSDKDIKTLINELNNNDTID